MKKLLFSFGSSVAAFAMATSFAAAQTAAPSPQATMAPSPAATPTKRPSLIKKLTHGQIISHIKRLANGSLTLAQVKYGVQHQSQEMAKLRSMKRVSFANIRIYRVPASLKKSIQMWRSQQAYDPFRLNDMVAQSSNPFLNIFANVAITNALNNILNSNTVNVSLNDILNANNVGIGQVVGLFINGAGIITTIVG